MDYKNFLLLQIKFANNDPVRGLHCSPIKNFDMLWNAES